MDHDNTKDLMLRAQAQFLLGQANAQAADIQASLGLLGSDTALRTSLSGALASVNSVISQLSAALSGPAGSIRSADLVALRQMVQAAIATAQSAEAAAAVQAASGAAAGAAAAVMTASAETRREVESLRHDIFDRHEFDPYLHFSSKQDEEEFRRREDERRRYIEAQLGQHTPEGNLNASGGMIDQMLDQQDHGAGNAPGFQTRFQQLVQKATQQRTAMVAAHQPTQEFDDRVSNAVRRSLERKHWTKEQIDNFLAQAGNPAEAARKLAQLGSSAQTPGLPAQDAAPDKGGSLRDDAKAVGAKLATQVSDGRKADAPTAAAPLAAPAATAAALSH